MAPLAGIDHLVIALQDLEAGARFYERLGFQVGARNRHPWGTENRLVQFDGSFLELITVGEGARIPEHSSREFSFGAYVRDSLARREGLAMVVLDSRDAQADARRFALSGLGDFEPFRFERSARRADGGETTVAFTLAFTQPRPALDAAFFVCQQHYPENFWNPAFQLHPNGAAGLGPVTLPSADVRAARAFLETFCGSPAKEKGGRWRIPLARGSIEIAAPRASAGFSILVPDLEELQSTLRRNEIDYSVDEDRIEVRPDVAFGVAIAFERS